MKKSFILLTAVIATLCAMVNNANSQPKLSYHRTETISHNSNGSLNVSTDMFVTSYSLTLEVDFLLKMYKADSLVLGVNVSRNVISTTESSRLMIKFDDGEIISLPVERPVNWSDEKYEYSIIDKSVNLITLYYQLSKETLNKMMSNKMVKVRIEGNPKNIEFKPNDKTQKNIRNSYDRLLKLWEKGSVENNDF